MDIPFFSTFSEPTKLWFLWLLRFFVVLTVFSMFLSWTSFSLYSIFLCDITVASLFTHLVITKNCCKRRVTKRKSPKFRWCQYDNFLLAFLWMIVILEVLEVFGSIPEEDWLTTMKAPVPFIVVGFRVLFIN